jgi:HK97 family phage portal protein
MQILENFIAQGFESFKTLAKVNQGLSTTDRRRNGNGRNSTDFFKKGDKITDEYLIEQNTRWVSYCLNKISSRFGEVPLRLYSAEQPAQETVLVPHKGQKIVIPKYDLKVPFRELESKEVKSLLTRFPAALKSPRVRGANRFVEILEHPFLQLMQDMNSYRDQAEVMEETIQFLELTGDAYWYRTFKNGVPDEIFLLPSQHVKVIPGEGNTWIKAYVFGKGPINERVIFGPEEIIHFRLPNLKNQYIGRGRLEPVIAPKKLLDEMTAYNFSLNHNGGNPSTIITFKDQNTSEEKIKKFKRAWDNITKGIGNAGNSFAHNGEADINVVGLPIKEMMFKDGQLLSRDEILAQFNVPKSMVDDTGTRANAEQGHYDFEKNTMKPMFNKAAEKYNSHIIPFYNEPSLFCAYDENVPEDARFELDKTTRLTSIGLLSRDEGRERENYGPADPDAIYLIQGGIMVTEQGENNDPNTEDTPEEEDEEV